MSESSSGRASTLLRVRGLTVAFPDARGTPVPVVNGIDLDLGRGEIVGLVGESGAGKSLTALALLRLVPAPGLVAAESASIGALDLLDLDEEGMRRVRGGRIGIVFQEPLSALNPVFSIGAQIREALTAHRRLSRRQALERILGLLELVAMPNPGRTLRSYPHQLSGGQRQRAMLAIALANEPELLIADEPTTALDVTVQAQILELLERLREELGLTVLLITHDLAVVAESCRRVFVMYAGDLVEHAPVADLFESPSHPYTRGLLASLPRLGRRGSRGGLPFIAGRVPEPANRPSGCAFHPRCAEAWERCRQEVPEARLVTGLHWASCHRLAPQTEDEDRR